jgi:hypothetical protein
MDAYHDLFSNRPSKLLSVAYSSILAIVFTPLVYSIILFERDNHHRTLINQLMASAMWTGVFWNLTVQPLAFYRFMVGPIPVEMLCNINSVLKNAIPMHILLLLDAILIVKYVFTFHMKNPTAMQDDFWKNFLNVWMMICTSISQVIYVMAPGKDFLSISI